MPMHDWILVDAGLFHDFHQTWTVLLCNALNAGVLPADHYALIEQKAPRKEPDVLTLKLSDTGSEDESDGGVAVAAAPPRVRLTRRNENEWQYYARKANRIAVRHRHGDVVSVIELVSPGNKQDKKKFQEFVNKAVAFINQSVSLLVIDLFPPTKRDPFGIHKPIWDEFDEEDFTFPRGKNRTLVSYDAGPPQVAYVENIGVGDALPEMPIFLRPEVYVNAPLESTYQSAWDAFPRQLKGLLESPPPRKKK
ncbi:MAG: DUF4058 family protein [Planctomycetes bacterium]|nr:DUF4058 family protein [Planctomycetota bacterium]